MPFAARVFGAVLLAGVVGASMAAGSSRAEREETYRQLALFARVLNHVQTSHAAETDPTALIHAAVRGMVDALDERSEFLTPEEVEALRLEARRQHFELGFDWRIEGEVVVVSSVEPGSAVARRGMVPGQRLVRVDGEPVPPDAPAVEDALLALVGDAKLLELVDTEGRSTRVRLGFAELRRPTVAGERHGVFAHVRVVRFTEDTVVDLADVMSEMGPIQGLVLDLRGNSGGVVEAAARTADRWLDSGVIATTEARRRVIETFVAHPYGTEPDYPLVVLVDGDTASAAELVALALQESKRATVVGTPTFGKGSVQTVIELEDGSALRLTVSRWFSAGHATVEGSGVRPDIAADDDVLEVAFRILRSRAG